MEVLNSVEIEKPLTSPTMTSTVLFSLENLENRIEKMYNLPEGFKIKSRKQKYVNARHLFILMVRNFCPAMSWEQIANHLNRENHSTALHMFKAAIANYSYSKTLRINYLLLCKVYNKNPYVVLNFHKGDRVVCSSCKRSIAYGKFNLLDTIFYYDRNVSNHAEYEHTTCHERRRNR